MELNQRLEQLHSLAGAIAAAHEELIGSIVRCAKKTYRVAAGEVELAERRLEAFGSVVPLLAGRAPLGTVAIVFPGNASLANPVATIGTAFLAGNRVLARFPRSSRRWADRIEPLFSAHLRGVRFDHRSGPEFI